MRYEKIFIPLILCFAFLDHGYAQNGPTPREIGDAYIETIGGIAAWKAIGVISLKGKTTMQGMQFPIRMINATGDRSYLETIVQGKKIIQAYDGQTAWHVLPFQGINEPTKMSAYDSKRMKENYFLSEFIDSELRGFKLEAAQGKIVDGAETYAVRVTNQEEYDVTYYFDTEYLIPIMTSTPIKFGPEKGKMLNTYFSDYQVVENVIIPHFIEVQINRQSMQQISISEVNLNPRISHEIFSITR